MILKPNSRASSFFVSFDRPAASGFTLKDMSLNFGSDKKRAVQAKYDAQKIAFAPIMFQAAKALRDLGILGLLKSSEEGFTLEEVAAYLKAGKRTVYRLAQEGKIPAFKLGGSWRFRRAELDRWIAASIGNPQKQGER